jgi:GH25 family lysozyme M1 (1,4-beta-N-acetylmuramidase)
MLDFEHVPAGWTASQIADWAETWMEELMRLTSLAGTLYCSRSFLDTNLYSVKAHPLYLAAWAPRTGPWSSAREAWTAFNNTQTSYLFDGPVTLWQYSATGVIPGAHESPNIDRGLMWGNEATLEALLYRKRYHGDISDVE